MDNTEMLDRLVQLEHRQARIIPASTGQAGWSNHLETRLHEERDYTDALLTEVIARLQEKFSEIVAEAHAKHVRGTFDEKATYKSFDIVAMDGASFIARKDNPGPLPGSGWQLLARQGSRGIAGPKGERGKDGKDGARLSGWRVEGYTATPIMSDGGYGPPLNLRSLFQQFLDEAQL